MIKKNIRRIVASLGYDIVPHNTPLPLSDLTPEDIEIVRAVGDYTMTSPESRVGLLEAVRYIIRHKIPGSIVECGVWKGGSMMVVALALVKLGCFDRDLYLFDTFEGMTRPGSRDIDLFRTPAATEFERKRISDDASNWVNVPLEAVRDALNSTGYPEKRIHLIKGNVLNTIPASAPKSIAILRLDTDWYESTRHELEHLFPLLEQQGVLIVDDYGHWRGSREATDEYLSKNNIRLLLTRMDYGARLAVKC